MAEKILITDALLVQVQQWAVDELASADEFPRQHRSIAAVLRYLFEERRLLKVLRGHTPTTSGYEKAERELCDFYLGNRAPPAATETAASTVDRTLRLLQDVFARTARLANGQRTAGVRAICDNVITQLRSVDLHRAARGGRDHFELSVTLLSGLVQLSSALEALADECDTVRLQGRK